MRVLLNVRIPHRQFNAAMKDGTAGPKLNRILEATKPEAVYFTEQAGQRGAVMVVDRSPRAVRVRRCSCSHVTLAAMRL